MPGNVGALEAGFEYQWLYGWFRVLDLLNSTGRAESVAIEDPEAGHFDDVTIRPRPDTAHAAEFIQVKFHVEQSSLYSAASLVSLGLLKKAWRTWSLLRGEFVRLELSLVTTWAWDPTDPVRIGDRKLSTAFVEGSIQEDGARATREGWRGALDGPPEDDFVSFLRALRFRTAYDEKTDLIERIRDLMEYRGLRSDDDALRAGADQVRQWVIARKVRVVRSDVEEAIERLALRAHEDEPSATLYVHTVRRMPSETGAEYEIDWRDAFDGSDRERGHLLLDPADWNARLLPELEEKAGQIERETTARLLRVRGLARLSAWFAVGFTFRETTGWTIETDQYGTQWRTDAPPSDDVPVVVREDLPGDGDTVALSIGVTGDPTAHVRHYLEGLANPAGKLVVVRTPREGRESVRSAGDLVRLSDAVKNELQSLVPRARKVLVFYWGPASGAVFIGHHLNAVASAIQIHEEKDGTYFPSFELR